MKNKTWMTAYARKIRALSVGLCGKLKNNRENLQYYAVLTALLIVLGTAAYSYRSGQSTPETVSAPKAESLSVSANAIPTQVPQHENTDPICPVKGEIIADYADEELVWSADLGQWQTHPAIDISAASGEAVTAIADGCITEVYCDEMYGNTIVIDHGEIGKLVYASLNTLQLVTPGQKVVRGEVISSIGSCPAEYSLGAHLHLEYMVNEAHENPFQLFSE